MADAETRKQRAAALEEKRRKLEEMKQRRKGREEVSTPKAGNLDEYIDGLLSTQPIPGNITSVSMEEEKEQVVKVEDKVNETMPTNVIAEPAPAQTAPPSKVIVETFAVATQTEEEDFPETPEVPEEEEDETTVREATEEDTKLMETDLSPQDQDPKVLSQHELEKEISSTPFSSFINTASKKVERMLGAPLLGELLVDNIGETDGQKELKDSDESHFVTSRLVFECANWTTARDVTDLDWSPLHREYFLSTHHMPNATFHKGSAAVSVVGKDTMSSSLTPRSGELQSDGLALVWSLTMPNRPEHIFTCGSPVTSGRFHVEPSLVIGGCESGQLVIWDTRAGRLPVQKSALTSVANASSKGHLHPIHAMEIIEGGLGLATSSTDGRVNFWSLSNLHDPAESIQVSDSVSCFAVVPGSEALLLGDDDGSLWTVQSPSQSGQRSSRRQVRKLESHEARDENQAGHFGMVTAVSTKTLRKGSGAAGLAKGFLRGSGGLVLSSGVDWTVKLWAPAYSDTPLLSMVNHSYDYMSDVKWSPTHPSLFATASSNGTVGLWDLASSFEDPLTGAAGLVIEPDALSGFGINKLKWSADGRRLAVASGDRTHVLTFTEDTIRSKGDEDAKVLNHLVARGLITRQ